MGHTAKSQLSVNIHKRLYLGVGNSHKESILPQLIERGMEEPVNLR